LLEIIKTHLGENLALIKKIIEHSLSPGPESLLKFWFRT